MVKTFLNEDLKYGFEGEKQVQHKLEDFFGCKFTQPNNKFSRWDFEAEGKKIRIEHKRRRCASFQYPTTTIGSSKINRQIDNDEDYYIVFSFTDGIYYIKYTDKLKELPSHTFNRNNGEVKKNVFIPREWLKPLTKEKVDTCLVPEFMCSF